MSEILNSLEYFDYNDLFKKILSVNRQEELLPPERMPPYIDFGPIALCTDTLVYETMIPNPRDRVELAQVAIRARGKLYFSDIIIGERTSVSSQEATFKFNGTKPDCISPIYPFRAHTHTFSAFASPEDFIDMVKPLNQGGVIIDAVGTVDANYMFVRTGHVPNEKVIIGLPKIVETQKLYMSLRHHDYIKRVLEAQDSTVTSQLQQCWNSDSKLFASRIQPLLGFVVYKGTQGKSLYQKVQL